MSKYATRDPDSDLLDIIGKAKASAEKAGTYERAVSHLGGPSPESGRVQQKRPGRQPDATAPAEPALARAPETPQGQKRRPGGPLPGGEVRELRPGVTRPLHFDDAGGLVQWFPPESLHEEPVLEGVLAEQLRTLVSELAAADKFVAAGIDAPTRLLFTGEPGTGKTISARWLAAKLGMPLAFVKATQLVGGYLGSTERNLGRIFDVVEKEMGILFLDEVDGFAVKRAGFDAKDGSAQSYVAALTCLLQLIDQVAPERPILMATNCPERLDTALLSRLTTKVDFPLPNRAARLRMIGQWLAKVQATAGEIEDLLERSEGKGGRELRAMAMAIGRKIVMGPARFGGLFPEEKLHA